MTKAIRIKFFAASVILCLILTTCYFILSGRTFFADLVADKVREAIEESGVLTISWDSIRGNPFTGVYISNAGIYSGETQLASVGEIGMQVALSTVASPSARLSLLSISGLVANLDDFSGISFQQQGSSGSSPVENLYFTNSTLDTPWGTLNLERASIGLGGNAYNADIRGIFADTPFSLECKAQISATDIPGSQFINISSLRANLLNINISASGRAAPHLEMTGEISNFDLKILADFLPFLDKYDLQGLYTASFFIANPNPADLGGLFISGVLTGRPGRILGMPLQITSANFYYSNEFFQIRDAAALAFNGNISADADVKFAPGNTPAIVARVNSTSIDTANLIPLLPWIENFAGTIDSASCELAGPINAISARARLTSASLNVASFSCSDVEAAVTVDRGSIINVDFTGNIQNAPATGAGNISIAEVITVNADVTIPNISTASLRSNFPQLEDFKVTGDAAVNINVTGPASALSYTLSISSPELSVLDQFSLSAASAELLYAGTTLNVRSAQARWQDATLTAEGSVTIPQGRTPTLAFSGGFSNLNIARLGDIASVVSDFNLGGIASGSWSLSGDTSKPISSVQFHLPKFFIYGKYFLSYFRAAIDYISPSLDLKSLGFMLGDSPITASGVVTLPQNNNSLEYNVKGSFNNLDPAIFVSMGLLSEDISGALTGDARVWKTSSDDSPSLRMFFVNSDFNYSNTANLSQLNGTLTYSNGGLQFDRLRALVHNGSISLDGTVGNITMGLSRPEAVPLNLRAAVTDADIGRIARMFNPASRGFQGLANVNAAITGNLALPDFTAEGALLDITAFGLFLPVIDFSGVTGNKDRIDISNISTTVGRGNIDAGGSINMAQNWETHLKATGANVDIRSLTAALDDEMRGEITGALDFNFEGAGPIANFRGNGHASVPDLSVFGLKMADVKVDVSVADGFVIVEDSSANAYGGNLTAQVARDINRSSWEGRIDVTSVDMGPLFHDLLPDSEGSITGKTNLSMNFHGDSRRTSLQDSSGTLEMFDGEVSGFEGAKAVSDMVGGRPLRFRSAHVAFSLDRHTIHIIPGSRISAPPEDPVYRYVTLDGSITTQPEINMSFMGNVNIRALNALIAGLQGVLAATVESGELGDTSDLLRNFLGNTITGFSRNEFHDVSLHLAGTPGDVRFSDITVESPVRANALPAALRNPDGYREDRGIRLRVEIPVGPGSTGSANGAVSDQLSSQILDQLIRGLIFDDE